MPLESQGARMILPKPPPRSIRRCASAAKSSGKTVSITGLQFAARQARQGAFGEAGDHGALLVEGA